MIAISKTRPTNLSTRSIGTLAIINGIISTIGVVCLITMFVLFATPFTDLALTFGLVNDICVAIQYLLTIPIALALYRILLPYNPALIRNTTIFGVLMMLAVIGLQLLLIFRIVPFEQQVLWVTPAMLLGVGAWLVITGWVARSTGKLPQSVLMSILAVPYLGYPIWAFWLGRHLLKWPAHER
jgi:hypothetical protein